VKTMRGRYREKSKRGREQEFCSNKREEKK
jgi:hypothetical protein